MMDMETKSMSAGKIISFEERKAQLADTHNSAVEDVDAMLDQLDRLHERIAAIQRIVEPNVVLEW